MADLVVKIPKEFEEDIAKLPELKDLIREFIKLKVFELELKRSRELQRFVFEALASKSKLTDEDALELGRKINKGMLMELKEKGLV